MICPHCDHTHLEKHNPKAPAPGEPRFLDADTQAFFQHPIPLVQEDGSRWTIHLYGCPECHKTFIA